MRKYIILLLFVPIFLLSGCIKPDPFRNPSELKPGEDLYRLNGDDISMPGFLRLPAEKKAVALSFEKAGAKPAEVVFDQTSDGWTALSGKTVVGSRGESGLIVDFTSGRIYEMPRDEVKTILARYKASDETVVDATKTYEEGTFPKIAFVDAHGMFNKDELKHLPVLNSRQSTPSAAGAPAVMPQVTRPEAKLILDKDAVIVGRPVINAAANGQVDRLMRLLQTNGAINETDPTSGDNALMKSLRQGSEEIAGILVDRGINLKHLNRAGQNALHISADTGLYDISKRLIEAGLPVSAKDNAGNTPLIYAATSPNGNVVDLLLDSGARITEANAEGDTAALLAAAVGNTKTVESLLRRGAGLNVQDTAGNTLVMQSVTGDNPYTLKRLLSLGAKPDIANKSGVTPLLAAVRQGNTEATAVLLDNGANINAKDTEGNTPLSTAVASGNLALVDVLMKYKPDVALANNAGKTPYAIARDKNYDRIARILGGTVEKLDAATVNLFERVAVNDQDGVRTALANGARVNAVETTTGNTPLFTAVANNYKFLAARLIDSGADVNAVNTKGNIPLIIAVTSADPEMLSLLIKAGSKVNAQNNNGDTALIWAVKLKRADMVRLLLLSGADTNMRNNDGVSAYMLAHNEGTPEILALLQAAGGHR